MKLLEYLASSAAAVCRSPPGSARSAWALLFGVIWPPLQQGINGPRPTHAGKRQLALLPSALEPPADRHRAAPTSLNTWCGSFGSFTDPETGRVVTGDLEVLFRRWRPGRALVHGWDVPGDDVRLRPPPAWRYRNARPERRKLIGGLLLSMALTAFLTGVTEPVEFAHTSRRCFTCCMRCSPACPWLPTDLARHPPRLHSSPVAPSPTSPWLGPLHPRLDACRWPARAGIYYLVFDFCIRRFNLKTGPRRRRESESGDNAEAERSPGIHPAALGGAARLEVVDAAPTRLASAPGRPRQGLGRSSSRPSVRWPWYVGQGRQPAGGGSAHRPTASPTRSAAPALRLRNQGSRTAWAVRTQPKRWCRCRPPSTPPKLRPGSAPRRRRQPARGTGRRTDPPAGQRGGTNASWPPKQLASSADRASAPSPAASAISWWAPRRPWP